MSLNKNKFGKQHLKNAELGTENHETQDVKPRTLNSGPATSLLGGPNFHS